MADLHTLVLRALGYRFLLDRLKAADEMNREDIRHRMAVGDRKGGVLPAVDDIDHSNLVVGSVTYARGAASARVTDPGALLHWVKQNRPGEVVEKVRDSYLKALLITARKEGQAVDQRTGEVIPGIEVTAGDPVLKVVPEKAPQADGAMLAALFADRAQLVRALIEAGE